MKTNPPSGQSDPTPEKDSVPTPEKAPEKEVASAPESASADYDIAPAYGQSHMHTTSTGSQAAAPVKKKFPAKIALMALGALLLLGVIAGAVFMIFGLNIPTGDPEPEATSTPSASETVAPAPSASATDAATAAPTDDATMTATDDPSVAATPAPLPEFESDAEKDAYFVEKARVAYPMAELTDEQMVGIGKKTCQRLDEGESVASIYEDILSLPTTLANDSSSAFGSGVGFYCPDYTEAYQAYMDSPSAEINELPKVEIPSFS